MRRPRLITFDIFGTLFKAEEVVGLDLMEEIIRVNGLSMGPEKLAELWWDKSYRVAHDRFATVREATTRALALLFQEVGAHDDPEPYSRRLQEKWARTEVYPDAPEAVQSLEGFSLGIVSNIDDGLLEALLKLSGLKDDFEIFVTSETCKAYKPDARLFQEALRRSGCNPEGAIHLGDTPVDDILGPKRVGMMAGWVNRRGERLKGRIPKPDLMVSDLQEAADLILQAE
ncbi:MAG: HAD family hydrolase [Candidatus Thermoplasmatota archaeon]|nr:HAD family hydrolase [Candidatus Thermoplasmatota archaeon]